MHDLIIIISFVRLHLYLEYGISGFIATCKFTNFHYKPHAIILIRLGFTGYVDNEVVKTNSVFHEDGCVCISK